MTTTGLLVLLALLWTAVTGALNVPNLALGLIVGALVLAVAMRDTRGAALYLRAWRVLRLIGLFIWELIAGGLQVARLVLTPNLRDSLHPAIIGYPLRVSSDAEITLLANLITLTPGTLSVDVSPDRRLLYVHVLTLADREAFIRSIAAGFERQVQAVFR
jgi:multicomponent Na+:H+ antiporter subunit E